MTTVRELDQDTIVFTTPRVITRREPHGVLLFHVLSDEIYFLSPAGFQLYERCRSGPRVADLQRLGGDLDVRPFLQQLLARELLETWDDPA